MPIHHVIYATRGSFAFSLVLSQSLYSRAAMASTPGGQPKCLPCDRSVQYPWMLATYYHLTRKHLRRLDDVSVLPFLKQASASVHGDQVQTISTSDEELGPENLDPDELDPEKLVLDAKSMNEPSSLASGFLDGGQEALDSMQDSLGKFSSQGSQGPPGVQLTSDGPFLPWTCIPCSRVHWLLDLTSIQPLSWNCLKLFHGRVASDLGSFSLASLVAALPGHGLHPGGVETGDSSSEDMHSENQDGELQEDSQVSCEHMSPVCDRFFVEAEFHSPLFTHNFLGDELLDDEGKPDNWTAQNNWDGDFSVKRRRLFSA
jgi:hypothetical protein